MALEFEDCTKIVMLIVESIEAVTILRVYNQRHDNGFRILYHTYLKIYLLCVMKLALMATNVIKSLSEFLSNVLNDESMRIY